MLSKGHEALEHQRFELVEELRTLASEYIHIFFRQLEGHGLKVEVTWAVAEHEAEVDMHHVTNRVQQNVSIVAIFDLQDIAQQGVASHRPHEILFRCLISTDADQILLLLLNAS